MEMTSAFIGALSAIIVAVLPAWLLYRSSVRGSRHSEAETALATYKEIAVAVRTDVVEIEELLENVKAELTAVSLQAHGVLTEVNWFRVVHGEPMVLSLESFEPVTTEARERILRSIEGVPPSAAEAKD